MVICYYPGAGGDRYMRFLLDKEFDVPNAMYDILHATHQNDDRYFDGATSVPIKEHNLSHCVNISHLRRVFPDHTNFVFLHADLMLCLRRAWVLKERFMDAQYDDCKKVDLAFSMIRCHNEYYKKYPWDSNGVEVVDIFGSGNKFCEVMATELLAYSSKIFDFAWDAYAEHGYAAPIIDIFYSEFNTYGKK